MEEKIILEKFKQWTENLSLKEAKIAVFEHIRDIPYAIIPQLRDPYRGPAGILNLNKGSCQPKHYLLGLPRYTQKAPVFRPRMKGILN